MRSAQMIPEAAESTCGESTEEGVDGSEEGVGGRARVRGGRGPVRGGRGRARKGVGEGGEMIANLAAHEIVLAAAPEVGHARVLHV